LAKEALATGKITTPSGRQFSFPDVHRLISGKITNFTQIKNYPVQSFATADIVPLILMYIERKLEPYQSCVVNSVHDSIVVDVHPNEEKEVLDVIEITNQNMISLIEKEFKIEFNVPLLLEAKIGTNWLDTKDVA
jgi:DNA polymerase I-like protein with 3'-5' exonuclease and polymerase domains